MQTDGDLWQVAWDAVSSVLGSGLRRTCFTNFPAGSARFGLQLSLIINTHLTGVRCCLGSCGGTASRAG